MFAFAPNHPWADGRVITHEAIQQQRLILYSRSSLTAHLLEDYFKRLQITPNTTIEVDSTAAIIKLVKLDQGVSIVAPWAADQELSAGKIMMRPLGTKPLHRRWAVISLASRRMTLAEEMLCRLCRNTATAMRLDRDDLPSPTVRAKSVASRAVA
jgi:DNA-binding transcriptional LysR family regulator